MTDYLYFLEARPGQAEALKDWLLDEFGPACAASPDCTGLKVNIGVEPAGGPALYAAEARQGDGFDAGFDLSTPDGAAFERLMGAQGGRLGDLCARVYGWPVTIETAKDEAAELAGNPAPGYKIMRGFFMFEDMPESARRRSWDQHVNLALKIHGFARYRRYWMGEPVTPDTPAIAGATNLHFPREATWKQDYFSVENGAELISQDVGHFIEKGLARFFAKEHAFC